MSGRFCEGWDYFPSGSSSAAIYAEMAISGWFTPWGESSALSLVAPGRYGYGQRLNIINTGFSVSPCAHIRAAGSNLAEGFIGVGVNIPLDAQSGNWLFLVFYDAATNAAQFIITFEANGVLGAYRGTTFGGLGTLLGKSAPGSWFNDVDFEVQAYGKIATGTAGAVEVKINGVSKFHLPTVDTQATANAYFDAFGYGSYINTGLNASMHAQIDDLRFWDTAGSINNSWIDTSRVQTLLSAGNGLTVDFTRSNTGLANWQNIKNLLIDDSLYLFDPTVGDYNLSEVEPLVNSPVVFWVQINGFYRQDDATQRYVKNRISSSGTIADGASFATAQTYSLDFDIFELDPDTGFQFTGPAVNALQVGPLVYA